MEPLIDFSEGSTSCTSEHTHDPRTNPFFSDLEDFYRRRHFENMSDPDETSDESSDESVEESDERSERSYQVKLDVDFTFIIAHKKQFLLFVLLLPAIFGSWSSYFTAMLPLTVLLIAEPSLVWATVAVKFSYFTYWLVRKINATINAYSLRAQPVYGSLGPYIPMQCKYKRERSYCMLPISKLTGIDYKRIVLEWIMDNIYYVIIAISSLVLVIVLILIVRWYRRRKNYVINDTELKLERMQPGSPLLPDLETRQVKVKIYNADKTSERFSGYGFCMEASVTINKNKMESVFVTASHVLNRDGNGTNILKANNGVCVEVPTSAFTELPGLDVAIIPYCSVLTKLQCKKLKTMTFTGTMTATAFGLDTCTIGRVSHDEDEIGKVIYDGSTLCGFSGSPYIANNFVFGVHTGSIGKENFGVSTEYIKSLLEAMFTVKNESWEEYINAEIAARKGQIRFKRNGDYITVRIKGKYHTIEESEVRERLDPDYQIFKDGTVRMESANPLNDMLNEKLLFVPKTDEHATYDATNSKNFLAAPVNAGATGEEKVAEAVLKKMERSSVKIEKLTSDFQEMKNSMDHLVSTLAVQKDHSKSTQQELILERNPGKGKMGQSTPKKSSKKKQKQPPKPSEASTST